MQALMQVDERLEIVAAAPPQQPRPTPSGFRRALPLVAMASGLAVMAVAALVMLGSGDGDAPRVDRDPSAITLSARDVSVVTQVYEPGHASGWHSHPGIHAVAVISGVLTVYDGQCQPRTVEPGQPYVGGQERHLVVNRTDAPVTMAVTYLGPSTPGASTEHMAAPAGCTSAG